MPPLTIDLRSGDADLEPLVTALLAGRLAVLPTDTVYGVAAAAHLPDACDRLHRLKRRDAAQPIALVCGSLGTVFETVLPELHGRTGVRASRLLPGPLTLVVPNPGRRFRWLCGPTPEKGGIRGPQREARLAPALDPAGGVPAPPPH